MPATGSGSRSLTAEGQWFISGIIDSGETVCPGGKCPPYGPMHLRGQVAEMQGYFLGDAAGLFGPKLVITMNCNLNSQMSGPCWGTFQWKVSDEEAWEGTWNGQFNLLNSTGEYKCVGHGQGGSLEGLKLILDAVMPGDKPFPYAVSSVKVLDPHGS